MLVNCPRCGFSQPKDRYCAQCGVDMLSFKPAEPSSVNKLLSSGAFQVVVLLIIAITAGTFIVKERQEQRWVQKTVRTQGVTKNIGTGPEQINEQQQLSNLSPSNSNDVSLSNLENQSIEVSSANTLPTANQHAGANFPAAGTNSSNKLTKPNADVAVDTNSANFKLSYIEVPIETLNRWEADSSRLGFFQNLGEYSAGILTDFRKRTDLNFQTLKSSDLKLTSGQSDTNLSGTMTEDGSRMVGLVTKIDLRSLDNGVVHGSINVTRTSKQSRESYPAEFDLPKGAVFFLIGSIKRQQFATEMNLLTMSPFQVLNSNDFRTQKSEFVIVVEPEFR